MECRSGHPMQPGQRYCPTCGSEIATPPESTLPSHGHSQPDLLAPPPATNPVEQLPQQQTLPHPSRTPKLIVWAFVLSLFGLFVLPGVAAVAMAIPGLSQAKRAGKGKGLAIAALVVSALWAVILIAIVASSSTNTNAPTTSAVSVDLLEEEAGERESVEQSQSTQESFAECVQSPYRTEYLATVSALLSESSDIAANAGNDGVTSLRSSTERLQAQGREYDEVGRQIKFADDCGDPEFGSLNNELGDILIQIGDEMSILNFDRMLSTGDVSDLEKVTATLGTLTNQVEIMRSYVAGVS